MATTIKRASIAFTIRDLEILAELEEKLGECRSQIVKRALIHLHCLTFTQAKKKDINK